MLLPLLRMMRCAMPPAMAAPGDGGGGANLQAAPPPARTAFQLELGDPAARREDRWAVPVDSPMVTSWPFIQWVLGSGANAVASAARSHLVGPCLMAARRPEDSGWADLDDADLLTSELDHSTASEWMHQMDAASAFRTIYSTFEDWVGATPALKPKVPDPLRLCLDGDSFVEVSPYDDSTEYHLAFLTHTSLGALLRADDDASDEAFQPHALARALSIFGSKDNAVEREDESSVVSVSAQRVQGILSQMLHVPDPSAPTLASKFVTCMGSLKLPPPFFLHAFSPATLLHEFERAFDYNHGTASEASAIERACILRVGRIHSALIPIVKRFANASPAAVQLERLAAELLPANIASANLLVRLASLDEILIRPAWSAAVTHHTNAKPDISGEDLVTALVNSQAELSGSAAGVFGSGSGLGSSSSSDPSDLLLGNAPSYGSVREQSIGDALRAEEAMAALFPTEPLTGVKRVNSLMRSGSVLLTRAMFLQESWLLNKTPALGFCSLESPNLCPHMAAVLTEDENEEIPDRLQSYVYPKSQLDIDRTPAWSKCRLLEGQMEIQRLLRGVSYRPVVEKERYILESALRMQSEYGGRRCYALGLSLSPQSGLSFPDCVDKQIMAVNFAHTLPATECQEWLSFLSSNFATNCLDAGGQHYHAKLRSARPDHPDSQLDEFLPYDNLFVRNIDARLKRAEPLADLRAAFPTLLSSAPISLPGSSASHHQPTGDHAGKDKGKATGKDQSGKSKGKGKEGKDAKAGPGDKSGWGYFIDTDHLWLCGMVFDVKKIAAHYKVTKPADLCWPVLLTKKAGNDALQLCPEHKTHGGLNSKSHKRPANFDLSHIYKNYTRKPSDAENAHAGWVGAKRVKKN